VLSETVVSAFLEVSITGAGLVLAVYALVTPISEKIFQKRAISLKSLIEEFEKEKNKITVDASTKDFKHLNELRSQIKSIRVFPRYLGVGVVATFSFFMLCALFSALWSMNVIYRSDTIEAYIIGNFFAALFILLSVGISTIIEIFDIMRKEFEDIKAKQREAKEYKITSA